MPIRPFPDPSNPATTAVATDPFVSNPILRATMDSATKLAAKAEVSAAKQEQITADTLSASGNIQGSIKEIAKDKLIITGVAANADLKAQNAKIATLDAAGGIGWQKELMKLYKEAGDDLIVANKERAESKESIVSSIIDLARKDLGMSTAESRANDAEDRRDDIGETIVGINAAQSSIVKSVNSTKETINAATIEANADAISQQAIIDVADAKLKSLKLNATAVRDSMLADAAAVRAKIQIVELVNAEENQEARRVEQEFRKKEFEAREKKHKDGAKARDLAFRDAEVKVKFNTDPKTIALRERERDEKFQAMEDDRRFEAIYSTNVKIGQTVLGLPVEDSVAIKQQGIDAKTLTERDRYILLKEIGERGGDYGLSIADSFETIAKTGVDPKLPAAKLVLGFNQGYIKSLKDNATPKTQALYNQALDTYANDIIAEDRKEIVAGDDTNIFRAPPMSILAERADVQASKLFKIALEPAKMEEFNDVRIYELALAGIASGELTSEEVVLGIETLFNAVVDQNNESRMFARAGMAPQTSYISRIVPEPFFSNKALAGGTGLVAIGGAMLAVPTPQTKLTGSILLASGAALGSSFVENEARLLTDNTDPTEIRNAVARLIAAEAATTLTGSTLFAPVLKGKGEEN